jgi:hypothetical protein
MAGVRENIVFLVALVGFAFAVLYITGRYYLIRPNQESFQAQNAKDARIAQEHAPSIYDTTAVRTDFLPEPPYVSNEQPILKLDDYEYSMIFQNEGTREAGKRAISDAMSGYPLDWTKKPPSDQEFQVSQTVFTDTANAAAATPPNTTVFDSISGKAMVPPPLGQEDMAERAIVQMYKPEETKDLIHYSLNDAKRLVERLYERRGKRAIIEPSKQGTNVFEIVEVDDIHPKIVWEDDIPAPERQSLRAEEQIVVPPVVNDLAAGLDPWFEPRTSTRMGRHEYYNRWSQGLERQFAPTYEHRSWY